jgi:hypothetical protein
MDVWELNPEEWARLAEGLCKLGRKPRATEMGDDVEAVRTNGGFGQSKETQRDQNLAKWGEKHGNRQDNTMWNEDRKKQTRK